jgi:tetratricopeptide (TPR) repeat protein
MATVKKLRQTGQLEEAMRLALEALEQEPDSVKLKRQLAWVLYDYAKREAVEGRVNGLLKYTQELLDLGLEDEVMLSTQMAWLFYKVTAQALRQRPAPYEQMVKMLDMARKLAYDTTEDLSAYVLLLRIAVRIKDGYPGLAEFIEWWDLSKLPENEFKPFESKQGQPVTSLAEQAYAAYAKAITDMARYDRAGAIERMERFLPLLEDVLEKHPEFFQLVYFKGPILLQMGRAEEAMGEMARYLRKKPQDFFAWSTLAEAAEKAGRNFEAMAAYARALNARVKPEWQGRLRENFGFLLYKQGMLVEAKTELQDVIRTRQQSPRGLPPRLQEVLDSDWYKETQARYHNRDLYRDLSNHAEDLLYADIPAYVGVVTLVNPPKKVVSLRLSREIDTVVGMQMLPPRIQAGDFVRVRVELTEGRQGPWYRVLTISPTDEVPDPELVTSFRGTFEMRDGQAFGFVDRKFYVPMNLIENNRLIPGQQVHGVAVIEYNKKRDSWGWKAVRLQV